MLTRDQLAGILDVFVKHTLLAEDEKNSFLNKYDKRYFDTRAKLFAELKNQKYADTKTIIGFIKECQENDLLANLHQYLLAPQFDYLRKYTGYIHTSFWQGTSANERVETSSKSWSMIEKALSLQMAHNVEVKVSLFSESVAKERAQQMSKCHPFFAIKRNTLSFSRDCNQSFEAFKSHDVRTFDKKYESHFRNFK